MDARHAVCVSSQGDPDLRKTAYRWRDSGPPPDAEFEYHAGRLAPPNAADFVLEVEGRRFAFADLRFAIELDEERAELDLVVEHPGFGALDEDTRAQVGYLALDSVLGEEEVERWIGSIRWSTEAPTATADVALLRAVIGELHARASSEQTWAVLRGRDALVVAARPLRPVDHPYFDHVCELVASLEDVELSTLQDHEEALQAGFAGRAFHAASLTAGASAPPTSTSTATPRRSVELAAWASERGYAFDCHRDPGWEAVRPFR